MASPHSQRDEPVRLVWRKASIGAGCLALAAGIPRKSPVGTSRAGAASDAPNQLKEGRDAKQVVQVRAGCRGGRGSGGFGLGATRSWASSTLPRQRPTSPPRSRGSASTAPRISRCSPPCRELPPGGILTYPAVEPPCVSQESAPGSGQGLLPYCAWPSIDGLALSPKTSVDSINGMSIVARVHVHDPSAAECIPSVRAACEAAIGGEDRLEERGGEAGSARADADDHDGRARHDHFGVRTPEDLVLTRTQEGRVIGQSEAGGAESVVYRTRLRWSLRDRASWAAGRARSRVGRLAGGRRSIRRRGLPIRREIHLRESAWAARSTHRACRDPPHRWSSAAGPGLVRITNWAKRSSGAQQYLSTGRPSLPTSVPR